MVLSVNLTLSECIKSATAKRLGLENNPTAEHLDNLVAIAQNVFQPLREHFGVPIAVTSGYRSKELNKAIKGSKHSQHCKGQALDLDAHVFQRITNKLIYEYIKDNLEFDQLIWEFGTDEEPDWVHVSFRKDGGNRKATLRARRQGGKTTYEHI